MRLVTLELLERLTQPEREKRWEAGPVQVRQEKQKHRILNCRRRAPKGDGGVSPVIVLSLHSAPFGFVTRERLATSITLGANDSREEGQALTRAESERWFLEKVETEHSRLRAFIRARRRRTV